MPSFCVASLLCHTVVRVIRLDDSIRYTKTSQNIGVHWHVGPGGIRVEKKRDMRGPVPRCSTERRDTEPLGDQR